jgi:DNA-binding CsgD family transcriptional regulator/tetratricopeptide (TPR) repeat protein
MLLERSTDLAALAESLAEVASRGRGKLILVGGEAGVGKSSLLRAFREAHERSHRVLWGACDDLFTPRPLGPLAELAHEAGPELERALATDAHPHEIVDALLGAMDGDRPAVVVLEDVQWADTATLDVVRLLGRRIEASSGLVIASYREDEPGEHLSVVLGDLATRPAVRRLSLAPLSVEAVAELSGPDRADVQELHRTTGGNPFFVTEVLAAGDGAIPRTVREAVLARASRLSEPARRLLGAVAIEPGHAEIALLERIAPEEIGHLEACVASGMLKAAPVAVSFRHELARRTIERALSPERRVALHRAALRTLSERPRGEVDPARLAHHAEGSGERDAVLRFAREAAERAAALGAHLEAAAHWGRALRFAAGLEPGARAELLERHAAECVLSGQDQAACDALESAIACRREVGDPVRVADALRAIWRPLYLLGRIDESRRALDEAMALLEPHPPGRELAMTYSSVATDRMMCDDLAGTRDWGGRALELAERLGDLETMAHALNNLGTAELIAGNEEGRELLERSVEIARRLGMDDHIARALNNLAAMMVRQRRYELVDAYLEEAFGYADEGGHYLLLLLGTRAEAALRRWRLAETARDAEAMLRGHGADDLGHALALALLGIVRLRRGEDGAGALLAEAHELSARRPEPDIAVFVATARAEAAWLEGDAAMVGAVTREALAGAGLGGDGFAIGELACWRRRAGIDEPPPAGAAEPFALELAGEHARAAELWTEIGCPFEAAMALAGSDDEDAQRRALAMLQDLGAAPAAAIVARRLRERGARGLPRGPRPATRENPANLTAREVEVLQLLAEGLPNAAIADRLVVSRRTVDHHVSAILRKLDVGTRGQASAEAVRLGLVALG